MAGFAILDTFLAHAPISRVFGRSVQFLGLFRISRNGPFSAVLRSGLVSKGGAVIGT